MKFGWETDKERLLKHIKMSPKKKLEWLHEINEFIDKFSSKSTKDIRQRLRKSH